MDKEFCGAKETLILTITERCNLSCTYCYEHQKDAAVMPVHIANRAIDQAFERNRDQELYIQFHGGEPLMAFAELKKICETTWSKGEMPRRYVFLCETNGTFFNKLSKNWFASHSKGIWAGLSLDGTKEMHDLNRSNSFDKIDLDFFLKYWPDQPVKMTVSRETLPQLSKGVIYMQERGFSVAGSLAYGLSWQKEDYYIYARELRKLAEYYLSNPKQRPSLLFSHDLHTLRKYEENKTHRGCGAGTNMTCVGMDGKEYACHVFMPSTQPSVCDFSQTKESAQNLLRKAASDITHPACKKCSIYSVCPTCYGMNFINQGNLQDKGNDRCIFSLIRAKASAFLWGSMLISPDTYPLIQKMPEYRKLHLIQAIEEVNNAVPDNLLIRKVNGEFKGLGLS